MSAPPIPNTTFTAGQKGQWGSLSYVDATGNPQFQELFVNAISQSQDLDGSSYQSLHKRHFYPRSHMPGDVVVEGYCRTSEDLQSLSWFIRQHQRNLLDSPSGNFQFKTSDNSQILARLTIPSESVSWGGYIKTFTVEKKGILVVAPTYTFNFVVIFDDTSKNQGISSRIHHFYTVGTQDPSEPNPPNHVRP